MGKEMTSMKNSEPLMDYKLQAVFQRRLRKQPLAVQMKLKTMGKCCKAMLPASQGMVDVVASREVTTSRVKRTRFNGTVKCHNLWACPVCAAMALTERAHALTSTLKDLSAAYSAFMITYTIPHTRRQPADLVIKKFQQVRRLGIHGTAEKYQREVLRPLGTVTTSEVTYSMFGWHYHQHVLYVIPKENWQYVEEFFRRVSAGWTRALIMTFPGYSQKKYRSGEPVWLSRSRNGAVLQVTDGRYLVGYGSELTKSRMGHKQRRNGVRGSRNLFDLITGTDEEFDLLCEWLLASRGLNRMRVTSRLKVLLDKHVAEKKISDTATIETSVVGSFTASGWHNLLEAEIETGLPLRYGVLKSALDGYESVVKFLARHNVNAQFLPSTRIFLPETGAEAEELAADMEVRKRRIQAAKMPSAVHDDIMMLAAQREKNLKAIEEYRRWAATTYKNCTIVS